MKLSQGHVAVRAFAVAALASALLTPTAALATDPPKDAEWTETYITEADGTKLHADVLRPKGLPAGTKTPVILSIGPYFNHSGQVGALGPVEDAPYEPTGDAAPSSRFYDFLYGADLMHRGYTYVMVDLRGFGASTGCLDWAGPGEQADVKAAVEWASSQPWSSGRVGMYGKSYDAVTGLIGIAQQPKGLAAVVAQEPVYDLYRYLYANRVRFLNSLATPALYDFIAESPGKTGDSSEYNQNSVQTPDCPAKNWADQQDPNHDAAYWKPRNLIASTAGKKTPLFLTQGLLENNTKPDGSSDFFKGIAAPKRAWFGMWDHVRGNDVGENGRLAMGRTGWFDEVMRFYDRYLKGRKPRVVDPPVVVESSDGRWRSEKAWPPADARDRTSALLPGSYSDDGLNNGSGEGGSPNGLGTWTFSPPLAHTAHVAGELRATVDADGPADSNLVADVYDVDSEGSAVLISRNAYLLHGAEKASFDLYDIDWILPAGHRLGVLLTGSNAEWWQHQPTFAGVTVKGGSVTIPFLSCKRTGNLSGARSIRLDAWLEDAPFTVDEETIKSATSPSFNLPPKQKACSAKKKKSRKRARRRR